ncbi:hypothetical protein [Lactobacillus helveticus]|uniref:hypothetical protein n=1 Tax=Lactobacillus helveticus TaxID=1587 RepID=UPI001567BCB2|nr:hypothetical protein [Lactobacillus helveticus]
MNMNEYNFLKSINDGKHHKPKNPDLYDQDNEEVQLILKLEKKGLIKFNVDLLDNVDYSLLDYWITDKGKQYVEENTQRSKNSIHRNIENIIISVVSAVIAALILYYVFHIN